ncbi:spore gernimation protein GerA [Paenibacillus sp. BIHB 4019]|uniref:Spore gernimation protein GerA n=1 Tax=Paenibacillus sp. BIHB 4019 TaxID=1870819 RepID=A0A1B2DNG0_9BACL|nr:spore germination protein [Paenibacillus sp. BIHB 4019]ANY69231.1 spore gernimation protein GerA [Paenibacillus sp. BIHB 4019]
MNKTKPQPAEPWNLQSISALFPHSADVLIQRFQFDEDVRSEIILVYSEGLCDTSQIGKYILPDLEQLYRKNGFAHLQTGKLYGTLPLIPAAADALPEQLCEWIFQGDLLLLFNESNAIFRMTLGHHPHRTPEESTTEVSIKGARDGFVEDVGINVALIRKRIRSQSLCYETVTLGRRTRTKVGLLYIDDIISPNVLSEVRNRLNSIDVDGLYSINQLEEMLVEEKYSLFPLLDFTGRPDYAVSSLLAGRFIVIVDGNPMVLIGPSTFFLMLKSPEDLYFNFQYVSFARLLRIFSFFISILLPGLWIALSAFHQDQIPFRLMSTIAAARIGLPFSGALEFLILLLLLEIFREAGVRLPSSIGQSLTVIGGLIIGDSAIRAGFVSPSVVVVGAITAVAGATLVNQSLSTTVSVIRFLLFVAGSLLGMYGFILGIVVLIGYMGRLSSFGVPFLSPFSPPIMKDIFAAALRLPWVKQKQRPETLHTVDSDKQGED